MIYLYFDWSDDRPPRTAWHDTVIYELHVKGFTALLSARYPRELRGRYAGARASGRDRVSASASA